jgi:peptidoglycan/LPS O-acetylase OafA/YrhL
LLTFAFTRLQVWSDDVTLTVMLPIMSLAFSLWIARLWYGPSLPRAVERVLLNPAMQYIGKVSYGVYLYHELVRVAVWYWGKPLMLAWPASAGYVTRLAAYILLSVALAGLSYEWIEKSFLRLRTLFRPGVAPAGQTPRSAQQAPTGT